MAKHKKHPHTTPQPEVPLGSARGQEPAHLHAVPPDGEAHDTAPLPPEQAEVLHHVMPGRQGYASEFLKGNMPGMQQRLAPNAATSDIGGWIEDDETVARLAHWHREAPHG